jgi:hypothetical protein
MRSAGFTYDRIAGLLDMTKARVQQVCNRSA